MVRYPLLLAQTGENSLRMSFDEKDVSTKQYSSQTHPRVSHTHEHDSRACRPQAPESQRAQAVDRTSSSQAVAPLRQPVAPGRFPKAARLRVRREFLALQRRGKRRYSPHFVVILAPAQGTRSRLGITVTRRFGNAVIRNRMKRLVREFFRSHQGALAPAQDILVIPRAGAEALTSAQVGEELRKALSLGAKTI